MRVLLIALLAAISYAQTGIPCIFGTDLPKGCVQRIKPCSEFSSSELRGIMVIEDDTNYYCEDMMPKLRDTVFTGPSTNTYFVKFHNDQTGKCYGIIMQAGECWGSQPNTGSDYDCQGRCGGGCSDGDANWARDCLKHDVCSWYFGASGGILSKDCSHEYDDAINDFINIGSACKTNGDSCDANQGKWLEDHKEIVCHKDQCKGTRTNPIPRGEQWVFLRQASETGCCLWGGGACDWCAPPPSYAYAEQFYQIIGSDTSHQIAEYAMMIFAICGVLATIYFGIKEAHKICCKRSDFRRIENAEENRL